MNSGLVKLGIKTSMNVDFSLIQLTLRTNQVSGLQCQIQMVQFLNLDARPMGGNKWALPPLNLALEWIHKVKHCSKYYYILDQSILS